MPSTSQVERVVIPYRPRAHQRAFHSRGKRFNVLVWHRRAGKTVACINDGIRAVVGCPHDRPHAGYIAPLYRQAKRVAWDYVKHFTRPIRGMRYLESELAAVFPHGGRFSLFGGDNPDALRGMYFDWAGLDEVAQMSPRVWTEVVRPSLADRQGSAVFIGTPMGRANQFHDLFKYASSGKDASWYGDLQTADDTGVIADAELLAMRGEMDEAEFLQELYCDWSATVRGAFYADLVTVAEREGRIRRVERDQSLPCVTSWDLGLADQTIVCTWQVAPDSVRCLSARAWRNTSLPNIIEVLKQAQPWSYSEHIAPHDIAVRELGSGLSRMEIAAEHGMRFTMAPKWSVGEGIDAVRNLIPRVHFDAEGCSELLEALRLYRADYDDQRRTYRAIPLHDWTSDWADAVRMFAVSYASRAGAQPDMFNDYSPAGDEWQELEARLNVAGL